jgi:hypothetical protein
VSVLPLSPALTRSSSLLLSLNRHDGRIGSFSVLNRVDLKDLKTYQQLYLYFVPTVTNIGFINIIVVVVRLFWFRKHLKKLGKSKGLRSMSVEANT